MLVLMVSKQSPVSGQQQQETGAAWREAEEEEEEVEEGISILCSPQTDSPR